MSALPPLPQGLPTQGSEEELDPKKILPLVSSMRPYFNIHPTITPLSMHLEEALIHLDLFVQHSFQEYSPMLTLQGLRQEMEKEMDPYAITSFYHQFSSLVNHYLPFPPFKTTLNVVLLILFQNCIQFFTDYQYLDSSYHYDSSRFLPSITYYASIQSFQSIVHNHALSNTTSFFEQLHDAILSEFVSLILHLPSPSLCFPYLLFLYKKSLHTFLWEMSPFYFPYWIYKEDLTMISSLCKELDPPSSICQTVHKLMDDHENTCIINILVLLLKKIRKTENPFLFFFFLNGEYTDEEFHQYTKEQGQVRSYSISIKEILKEKCPLMIWPLLLGICSMEEREQTYSEDGYRYLLS